MEPTFIEDNPQNSSPAAFQSVSCSLDNLPSSLLGLNHDHDSVCLAGQRNGVAVGIHRRAIKENPVPLPFQIIIQISQVSRIQNRIGVGIWLAAGDNAQVIQVCCFDELIYIPERAPGKNHFSQSIFPWQMKGLMEIWIPQVRIYQKDSVSFNCQSLGKMHKNGRCSLAPPRTAK